MRWPWFLGQKPCRGGNRGHSRKKLPNIRHVHRLLSILRTGALTGTLRRTGHDCQPPRCTRYSIIPQHFLQRRTAGIYRTTRSVLCGRGLDLNRRVAYRILSFSFLSEFNNSHVTVIHISYNRYYSYR